MSTIGECRFKEKRFAVVVILGSGYMRMQMPQRVSECQHNMVWF